MPERAARRSIDKRLAALALVVGIESTIPPEAHATDAEASSIQDIRQPSREVMPVETYDFLNSFFEQAGTITVQMGENKASTQTYTIDAADIRKQRLIDVAPPVHELKFKYSHDVSSDWMANADWKVTQSINKKIAYGLQNYTDQFGNQIAVQRTHKVGQNTVIDEIVIRPQITYAPDLNVSADSRVHVDFSRLGGAVINNLLEHGGYNSFGTVADDLPVYVRSDQKTDFDPSLYQAALPAIDHGVREALNLFAVEGEKPFSRIIFTPSDKHSASFEPKSSAVVLSDGNIRSIKTSGRFEQSPLSSQGLSETMEHETYHAIDLMLGGLTTYSLVTLYESESPDNWSWLDEGNWGTREGGHVSQNIGEFTASFFNTLSFPDTDWQTIVEKYPVERLRTYQQVIASYRQACVEKNVPANAAVFSLLDKRFEAIAKLIAEQPQQ